MSGARVLALAGRILRQFRHDRRTVALIVIVPLVVMALIGYLVSDDKQPLPVAVVNLDEGGTAPAGPVSIGDRIADLLRRDEAIEVVPIATPQDARRSVADVEVAGAVILHPASRRRRSRAGACRSRSWSGGSSPACTGPCSSTRARRSPRFPRPRAACSASRRPP